MCIYVEQPLGHVVKKGLARDYSISFASRNLSLPEQVQLLAAHGLLRVTNTISNETRVLTRHPTPISFVVSAPDSADDNMMKGLSLLLVLASWSGTAADQAQCQNAAYFCLFDEEW